MGFRLNILCLAFIFVGVELSAQPNIPKATSASDRFEGFERRKAMAGNHVLQNLKFKSIGPTIMGGRVTDIEINPTNPNKFYVAYASGGLWYTNNNGQSYTPLFDREIVMTIGDIAVDWKRGTIWIGTGEQNSSRSSYAGCGLYRSDDQGKTWKHMGLGETHRTGRIILHPTDSNVVWVAALGHLYSPNPERGIYKSIDGGKTWKKTLFVDDMTGAIDLVCNSSRPNELYAAMWYRDRKAWNFVESGPSSGIFKSTDGGNTWSKVTVAGSGFPQGDGLGRIGLAHFAGDKPVLFALLDNQHRRPKKDEKKKELSAKDFRTMSKVDFLALKEKELNDFLKEAHFPKKYTADTIRNLVRSGIIEPVALADYVEDANQQLFDTDVIGAEVYRSDDGGKTWKKTHSGYLDDVVFTYGYYFGQIRVSRKNPDKIYISGVPILRSSDGGKTFESINGDNQHVDHHAIWVNPKLDGHLINGNDGGINISYDDGKNWMKVKSPPVGQFYTVNVDLAKPYKVYGGLQDNGVWMGPSGYKEDTKWEGNGRYPYERIMGGDGFKVEIDSRNRNIIYAGYQFGNYFRLNKGAGPTVRIQPKQALGERPLRFNWQTPIHLSRHQQDVFYIGSNKFHRSLNQGDDYGLTSGDLTRGPKKGDVSYGTLTTIHESPLKFGLIYVGSDDGLVHRSDDLGYTWKRMSKGLPENLWVSSVQASSHDTMRVYLALNGYRWDHFDSYIYVSDNGGEEWKRLGSSLPAEPVNVFKEDPVNKDLLYVGTDNGLYISIDRGKTFMCMENGLPAVAVHDLVVHPREHHLIVATHGRSLYKANVTHLQKLTESVRLKSIHCFPVSSVTYNENWGEKINNWKKIRQPVVESVVYVESAGSYTINVKTKTGLKLFEATDTFEKGLNYYTYNLDFDCARLENYQSWLDGEKKKGEWTASKSDDEKCHLRPGEYVLSWTSKETGKTASTSLKIKLNDQK